MTINQTIVIDYLEKHSNMATQTLARLIYKSHSLDFKNLEAVRSCIRIIRGEHKQAKGMKEFKRTTEEKKSSNGWKKLPE